MKKIRGRKSHQLVTRAEDRARHRTPGQKRFVHIDLSWRGTIAPNYMAAMFAMSAMISMAARVKSEMRKGRGR